MAVLLLTKGLVLITAVISLASSESNPNEEIITLKKTALNLTKRWKCSEDVILKFILPEHYEDNARWILNIDTEGSCRMTLLVRQLREENRQCIDNVTFVYGAPKITTCRNQKITTPSNVSHILITVLTGVGRFWKTLPFISWLFEEYHRGGFVLTLHGVSKRGSTEAPAPTSDMETTVGNSLNDQDPSRQNYFRDPECSKKKLVNDLIQNSTSDISYAAIDCTNSSLISTSASLSSDGANRTKDVISRIKTRGLTCKEWCNLTVPNITDLPIMYLNGTHAITAYGELNEQPLVLYCAQGFWSSAPSCQGFREEHLYNEVLTERRNLIPVVLAATFGVLAVTTVAIVIWLVVRRRSLSTKKADVNGTVEYPDATIAMEDNPVYG